jgi:hypothetical protein
MQSFGTQSSCSCVVLRLKSHKYVHTDLFEATKEKKKEYLKTNRGGRQKQRSSIGLSDKCIEETLTILCESTYLT